MKKYNLIKIINIKSCFAILALMFAFSCEDDSLPEEGSIEDINLPTGAFTVSESETSSLIKILNNTSRSATSAVWELPDGANYTEDRDGVLTDSDDQTIYVQFDDFATYSIGITASDDNGVVAETNYIDVIVEPSGDPDPTIVFDVELVEGGSNFERLLVNNSSNDSGGVVWSISQDGEQLDMATLLATDELDYANQTETDETIFVTFPGSGEYEVTLTAYNFDNVEASDSDAVTVDPLSEPVPEFTFSSSEDYSIKTFVNTTPDTGRVVWNFPAGVTFENGTSETDETVDVSFPSSGTYEVSLDVYSNSFDDDGVAIELAGIGEVVNVPVVNSVSEITTPVIFRGGFEPGEVTNPADATNFGTPRNDLGKEWWAADGVSSRAFLFDTLDENGNTIKDETETPIDTGLASGTWFADKVRISNTASNVNTGLGAASWNALDERAAVQTIDVVPGVDYTVTFNYRNRNFDESGLRVLILDEGVSSEADLEISSNILSQVVTDSTSSSYVEETISFSVNSADRTAVKLYFNHVDLNGQYNLDDVSIAID